MFQIPFYQKPLFPEERINLDAFYTGVSFEEGCKDLLRQSLPTPEFILTKSCSQALELALLRGTLPEGSEVILPSFAYVSLANAVYNNGLRCVFVDIEPETMNISPLAIEAAVNDNTSAIICINYAGVGCRYEDISPVTEKHGLLLVEDNAHGIGASYKGKMLGTFGDLGTFSFDALKHLGCYEGGGIAVNRRERYEELRIKALMGTNRDAFFRGDVAHYEWVSEGTNTRLAAPLFPILLAQLKQTVTVVQRLRELWDLYFAALTPLQMQGRIDLAKLTADQHHNGHTFWIKLKDQQERLDLQHFLARLGIQSAFHYFPLHLSSFGQRVGMLRGEDKYTSSDSLRLLRLPLYFDMTDAQHEQVISAILSFFKSF